MAAIRMLFSWLTEKGILAMNLGTIGMGSPSCAAFTVSVMESTARHPDLVRGTPSLLAVPPQH
jgi:hypothetical protein